MAHAFICDYERTPIGRYGGGLAIVRADDLGAVPIKALMARNNQVDWGAVDEVCFGCANQAGEDNRNVARMALLLAGLPETVPGTTLNRLCGSGMDAVITAVHVDKVVALGSNLFEQINTTVCKCNHNRMWPPISVVLARLRRCEGHRLIAVN